MAIPKQVKVGGSYYQGEKLTVAADAGDYTLFATISSTTGGCGLNGVTIVPSKAGSGDSFKLEHKSNATGGSVMALLATSIYNMGANVAINLDFFALELMKPNESLKLTYTNVAATSMEVYMIVERGR